MMKAAVVAACLFEFSSVAAFSIPSSSSSTTSNRRDWLESSIAIGSSLATALIAGTSAPGAAQAEIDYAKIQNLLGEEAPNQRYDPSSGRRPMYLTEPTEEFKQNESKATEFRKVALERKMKFTAQLDKLNELPNDADALSATLDTMTDQVRQEGGLPEGITKEEVVKIIRRRKAKKFWPTPVEIS